MKRITFITGYYGSGKTEIALNLAIQKKLNVLVDLDIINPYFRSRELKTYLLEFGIETISSDLKDGMYADLPYISKRVFLPFQNKELSAIYDLGGNDLGAKLLRQFDNTNNEEVDNLLIINVFREETSTKEKIIQLIHDIEEASGWKITGLIHNSNLLKETSIDDILYGEQIAKEVVKETGLKVIFSCISDDINLGKNLLIGELLPIKIYLRKKWY
ncbi:MAG: ATP-binding protein [Firmicutes bacterium]|nr:ATP-binding protein [Bacillota bacterium]